MRILLTGSTGWLGRYLAPKLRALGHTITGFDIAPGPDTQVVGTVADAALVDRVFAESRIETVIHAGALHKPDIVRFSAQSFIDTNVTGTLNLLQAAVRHRHDRFVMTSTTSLMITKAIREEAGSEAVWLDERTGPLEPRNIYGTTKLAAEGLCRIHHHDHGLNCIVLRTGRFFPEDDDTLDGLSGWNLKANELLHRRLTVEDAAEAHVSAMGKAPGIGFGVFVVSAPSPFHRNDAVALKADAAAVIEHYFPDAPRLYANRGWHLPQRISRVYDASLVERQLGFRCSVDFGSVLEALRDNRDPPFAHDPGYISPSKLAV
jgi:UDP-glucose 4-epimerase